MDRAVEGAADPARVLSWRRALLGLAIAGALAGLCALLWLGATHRHALLLRATRRLPVEGCVLLESAPPLYAQIKGRELRVAASPDGLAAAPPRAASSVLAKQVGPGPHHSDIETTAFPPIPLPVQGTGLLSAQAQLRYSRILMVADSPLRANHADEVRGTLWLTARDAAGQPWTYRVPISEPARMSPSRAPGVAIPTAADLQHPSTRMLVQGFRKQVEVFCALETSNCMIDDISQNGREAQVHYEIRDQSGARVHEATVALGNWNAFDRVALTTPGTYRVTATVLGPTFLEPVTGEARFIVTKGAAGLDVKQL